MLEIIGMSYINNVTDFVTQDKKGYVFAENLSNKHAIYTSAIHFVLSAIMLGIIIYALYSETITCKFFEDGSMFQHDLFATLIGMMIMVFVLRYMDSNSESYFNQSSLFSTLHWIQCGVIIAAVATLAYKQYEAASVSDSAATILAKITKVAIYMAWGLLFGSIYALVAILITKLLLMLIQWPNVSMVNSAMSWMINNSLMITSILMIVAFAAIAFMTVKNLGWVEKVRSYFTPVVNSAS